ncbi:MAG TPA: NEW3 domain-containing protein [Acidobacteriota bacterium]|nr:NEW3 domain-containing protein [Acidobacteriota bacterium]
MQPQEAFQEQQKLLDLRSAQFALIQAKTEFDRQRQLYDEGIISESQLTRAEASVRQAQIAYQRVFLGLFSELPDLTVVSAVKSRTKGGGSRVALTVRNTSGANLDYRQLGIVEEEVPIPDQLELRQLKNLFASLEDQEGSIVSKPYEHFLPELAVGEDHVFDFSLLKDVDEVLVSLKYSGKVEEYKVVLEKDASANVVDIRSRQFSQEANLGTQAVYDLNLERFTDVGSTFRISVVNLPSQFDRQFLSSAESTTRLRQIRFAQGETTKALALRISLPEIVDPEKVPVDQSIPFWVVLQTQDQAAALDGERRYQPGEVWSMGVGAIQLEITPKGVGKLEVRASNLYREIQVGEALDLSVQVRNSGTRRLENIRLNVETPPDWIVESSPELLPQLEVGRQQQVRLRFLPPSPGSVGDYNIRIETLAFADNKAVESEDKVLRIRMQAPVEMWKTASIVGLLLAVVAVLVASGIKIAKR